MNYSIIRNVSMSVALVTPLAFGLGCSESGSARTSHEVSHTESNKTGWFGGQTHEANTVYKNSDGSTSVETETSTTKGNVTTIVREKKTTNLNGIVKVDRETRTVDKGSDSVQRESKTTTD